MNGPATARGSARRLPLALALIAALSVLAWTALATWSAGP
jgi:hypothetical protein